MEWILGVTGCIVAGFVGNWLFWQWKNVRKLRVSVATRGVVACVPLHPSEEHVLQVTITNVGNKVVNLKQCYFTVDGETVHIAVLRDRLITMREGLPRTLAPDDQCTIGFPANAFYGRRLTRVMIEDHLGNRWYARGRSVRGAALDLERYRIAA